MPAVSLGKYDRILEQGKQASLLKNTLREMIQAAGGELVMEVHVPYLRLRPLNGRAYKLRGRIERDNGSVENLKHRITEETIDSDKFAPALGIDIVRFIERENRNLENRKKGLPIEEHPHVTLNNGLRVTPFDVGPRAYFEKRSLENSMNAVALHTQAHSPKDSATVNEMLSNSDLDARIERLVEERLHDLLSSKAAVDAEAMKSAHVANGAVAE